MDFLNRIVNKPDFLLGLLSVFSCALVVFCSGSAASICYPGIRLPLLLFTVALWCFASLGRLKHFICCRVADWTALLFMLVLIVSIIMRQGSGFFFGATVDVYFSNCILDGKKPRVGANRP